MIVHQQDTQIAQLRLDDLDTAPKDLMLLPIEAAQHKRTTLAKLANTLLNLPENTEAVSVSKINRSQPSVNLRPNPGMITDPMQNMRRQDGNLILNLGSQLCSTDFVIPRVVFLRPSARMSLLLTKHTGN